MPISARCPSCQALFELADVLAGKLAKCSRCQHQFRVGSEASEPAPASAITAEAPIPARLVPSHESADFDSGRHRPRPKPTPGSSVSVFAILAFLAGGFGLLICAGVCIVGAFVSVGGVGPHARPVRVFGPRPNDDKNKGFPVVVPAKVDDMRFLDQKRDDLKVDDRKFDEAKKDDFKKNEERPAK